MIEEGNKKLVYCPCHSKHLPVNEKTKNPDILIINCGIFEKNIKGATNLPEEYRKNTLFEKDNLRLIKAINPKKTILTHIEEPFQRSYDEYGKLEKKNFRFAYDGMKIKL